MNVDRQELLHSSLICWFCLITFRTEKLSFKMWNNVTDKCQCIDMLFFFFFLLTLSKGAENCSGQIRNVVVPANGTFDSRKEKSWPGTGFFRFGNRREKPNRISNWRLVAWARMKEERLNYKMRLIWNIERHGSK